MSKKIGQNTDGCVSDLCSPPSATTQGTRGSTPVTRGTAQVTRGATQVTWGTTQGLCRDRHLFRSGIFWNIPKGPGIGIGIGIGIGTGIGIGIGIGIGSHP